MRRLRPSFTKLLLLAVLMMVRPASADEVDVQFTQGTTALKAGKYQDALKAFEAVWKQRKTHDVAANLALAEMQLGRHRDAAEHLAFAIRAFPVTGDATIKKGIETAFAQAKSHVTTLRLDVNIDGAEVKIDGVVVGRSPLADEVFVEPGTRTVEARLARHATTTKTIEAKKGGADVVSLVLSPEPVPTVTPTASVSAVPTAPPPRSKVPGLVMGGVGVASLIAGGVLVGVAAASGADIESKSITIRNAGVGCPVDPRCEELESSARAGDTMSRAGVGLLIGGAALGAGGLLYLLWPAGQSSQGAVRVMPMASGDGVGLTISGAM